MCIMECATVCIWRYRDACVWERERTWPGCLWVLYGWIQSSAGVQGNLPTAAQNSAGIWNDHFPGSSFLSFFPPETQENCSSDLGLHNIVALLRKKLNQEALLKQYICCEAHTGLMFCHRSCSRQGENGRRDKPGTTCPRELFIMPCMCIDFCQR